MGTSCCCCEDKENMNNEGPQRTTVRTEEDKKSLVIRLNRLEGQIRGIRRMIESDAYCNDVLVQCAAVNAALSGFTREILSAHIHGCVARDIRNGKDDTIDELIKTVQKLMK